MVSGDLKVEGRERTVPTKANGGNHNWTENEVTVIMLYKAGICRRDHISD